MSFENLRPIDLQALMRERPELRLVDVRGLAEVAQGRIAGALHLPLMELGERHAELLPKETPLVLYCLSGARSARACLFLAQFGYGPLYNLEGGIAGWVRSGLPLD